MDIVKENLKTTCDTYINFYKIKTKHNFRQYSKELAIVGIILICKFCVNEISYTHKHGNYNVDYHMKTKIIRKER